MTTRQPHPRFIARRKRAGFTGIEVLVYLTIGVIIVGGVYVLILSQNRLYGKQREQMDVRSSIRSAANLLSWELRQASSSGDLYSITPDSVSLRAAQGQGVVCAKDNTLPRLGLYAVWGDLDPSADSALIFATRRQGPEDDEWLVGGIKNTWLPGGAIQWCVYGDSTTTAPDLVIEIQGIPTDSLLENVKVGAPIRSFRQVQYGIFQEAGRWWLGRRAGGGLYKRLSGPLRAPSDSGLVFTYYDDAGSVTTDPFRVAMVEIALRGESEKAVMWPGVGPERQRDAVTTRVFLRGNMRGSLGDGS
jgi:hypothetical protein